MRVDVHALVVQVGQAGYAAREGVGGWAVAGVYVVVVALPVGEVFPMDCEGRGGVGFGCGTLFVVVIGSERHCFFL